MSVVSILSGLEDSRKGSKVAKFNGFLEDFLNSGVHIEASVKETLQGLFETYPDLKVVSDFRFNVNKHAISNQIIRYKDVNKLPENYFDFSFILYGDLGEREIAILLADGQSDMDYFLAKGMYYCLTEQHGLLEQARQNVMVLTYGELGQLKEILDELGKPETKIGVVQRKIDKKYFNNYNDLQTKVMEYAQGIKDNLAFDVTAVKDRSVLIYQNIAMWFLFKKLLYVQYMGNRDLLHKKAQDNMKKHRTFAKELVDQVPYVAYSEMWRLKEAE